MRKLIISFVAIIASWSFFAFNTVLLCGDCFHNRFGGLLVLIGGIIFLISSIALASSFKKSGKKWKTFYTAIAIAVYIITIVILYIIGENVYVPNNPF